jgi:4-amino-4-deoxy-L-arabinose transferase-like glycosyltransferase
MSRLLLALERPRVRRTALGVILAVAAAMRLWGITWGLPDRTHLFSYHPDEYFSLSAAFSLAQGDLNPRFFNYPSLYLYLAAAAGSLAGHVGTLGGALTGGQAGMPVLREVAEMLRPLTLDARLVTVLLSLGTVLAAYGVAGRLAGPAGALCAAAALAVMPGHVLQSHWATVDVPLAFFTTLSLYAALRLREDAGPRAALLAGLACGAAMATKYNGALVLAMPLAALAVRAVSARKSGALKASALQAGIVIVAMAAAFVCVSPYVLLDWTRAREGIAFEIRHMRAGEYPAQTLEPNGWWFHLRALCYGTGGCALLTVALALGLYGVWRTWPRSAPLAAFAALWFAAIGAAGVRYARYGVPLLPLLAIGSALGVAALLKAREGAEPSRVAAWVGAVALVPLVALPAACSGLLCRSVAGRDPRDAALSWVPQHVPPGARVGVLGAVWFDMPPLDYNNGGEALGDMYPWVPSHRSAYKLVRTGTSAETLDRERPEWLIASDFPLEDLVRAGDHAATAYVGTLSRYYGRARDFPETPRGPLLWGACGDAPHEWRYVFRRIHIWQLLPKDGRRS